MQYRKFVEVLKLQRWIVEPQVMHMAHTRWDGDLSDAEVLE